MKLFCDDILTKRPIRITPSSKREKLECKFGNKRKLTIEQDVDRLLKILAHDTIPKNQVTHLQTHR